MDRQHADASLSEDCKDAVALPPLSPCSRYNMCSDAYHYQEMSEKRGYAIARKHLFSRLKKTEEG